MKTRLSLALVLTLTLLVFSGCREEKKFYTPEKPENFIPREKMIKILVDMHLVGGASRLAQRKGLNFKEFSKENVITILKKYNISAETLDENMFYYSTQVEEYNEMYMEVLSRLSKMQSEVETQ